MAIIQSGATADLWTIDPISNAGRVTLYDKDGNPLFGIGTALLLNQTLDSLNETAVLNLSGQATTGIFLTGSSGTFTISFEANIDTLGNWFSVAAQPLAGGVPVSTISGDGVWFIQTSGFKSVRLKVTAYTTGSTTASLLATPDERSIAGLVSIVGTVVSTGYYADNTINTSDKLAVLPAIAKISAPSWTDGYKVPLTTLLTGALRIDNTSWFGSTLPTVGQKIMTSSIPVVISSDQSSIPVGTGSAGTPSSSVVTIQGITGGVSVPVTIIGAISANSDGYATSYIPSYINNTCNPLSLTLAGGLRIDGSAVTQPISALSLPLPTGAATEATLSTLLTLSGFQARINTLGQKTMANSTPVVISSDQSALTILGTVTANQGTSPWVNNISQFGGNNIVTGTGASGVGIPRVTVSNDSNILATQSGSWTVQPGNTANTTPWLTTINQGGNSAVVKNTVPTSSDQALVVSISPNSSITTNTDGYVTTVAPTYTNNTFNYLSLTTSGLLRVDGSSVTQPVSGIGNFTVVQTIASNLRAQTSAESVTGASPPANAELMGGSVTTAAPAYTTGQMNALSLTTGGLLRIDGSGVTQPVSGTITANIGTTNGLALDATLSAQSLVDNAGFTDGASRVVPSGYILDETAGTALTENDIAAARVDSKRAQIVVIEDATTRGQRLTITAANAIKVDGSAVTQPVSGTVTANAGTGNFTVVQTTASSLRAQTSAESATGAAPPANAELMGGSVTTAAPTYTTGNMGALSLTTSGLLRIDGSGVTQPVSGTVTANIGTTNGLALDATLTGGTQTTRLTDGTNTATVKAASTAAVAADKALVVAISPNNIITTLSDGYVTTSAPTYANNTNQQLSLTTGGALRVDFSNSTQTVQGVAANGAAVSGNPVLVAGFDGTNARTLKTLTDGTQVFMYKEQATFTALSVDTALANNKSVFSIVNASGSTVVVRISAIYITSVQTTTAAGVTGFFELRRIVNHSAGTAITAIESMDTTDSLNSSVTVRTNGTITTESSKLLWRAWFSTDEWVASSNVDTAFEGHIFSTMFPVWNKKDLDDKPIILRANEGLTVKFATNSSVGTFDIMVVFTQE